MNTQMMNMVKDARAALDAYLEFSAREFGSVETGQRRTVEMPALDKLEQNNSLAHEAIEYARVQCLAMSSSLGCRPYFTELYIKSRRSLAHAWLDVLAAHAEL
jgi:hypothetical protein